MSVDLTIAKSSRHPKITGDFGETLVTYCLSKYGFECGRFDHIGIDIVAANPYTHEIMGISVKSRSRSKGAESESLLIKRKSLQTAREACAPFGWVPYFAIVVDADSFVRCFVLSMEHLESMFPAHVVTLNWKMGRVHIARYYQDPDILIFELHTATVRWWGGNI